VLTFIGGGYIACELAHFFGSLGTKINIIQRNKVLIPNEDEEISEKFTQSFSEKYQVYLEHDVELVAKADNSDGSITFQVTAKKRNEESIVQVDSDQLIVSTGRVPNINRLSLDKTGVEVNESGFIKVDKYLETTTPGIFAIGDVVGRYQFKHNANLEAQYAYANLLSQSHNKKIPVDYTAMPHAIFSSPQVASVGYTEQELKNQEDIKYLKSIYPYIQTGMGLAINNKEGFIKFLVNKENRKILGCHILGTDASTLIHEVLVSMRTGDGTIDSISNTVHIHPALSEVVGRAAASIPK
jgi:dihydrolipoamide dehydrogenase